ncbi:cell wall-binding repeat-containing protein [Buchananella felis]|uniref:cell wall-binding repeat-containing protein n=1 Tax=Buchananella felis TaxID=3231492 RepID=UPI003529AD78
MTSTRRSVLGAAKLAVLSGAALSLLIPLAAPVAVADASAPAPAPSQSVVADAAAGQGTKDAGTQAGQPEPGATGGAGDSGAPGDQAGQPGPGADSQENQAATPAADGQENQAATPGGVGTQEAGGASDTTADPSATPAASARPLPSAANNPYPASGQEGNDGLRAVRPGPMQPFSTFGYKPKFSFDKNLLITDSLFFRGGDMSIAEIRAFLNEKGKNCKSSPWGTCLKDYRITTVDEKASRACPVAYKGVKDQDIASIIYYTSLACNVSARALMTTLEKEQGMITASKPPEGWRYESAMGFGCPDGQPCFEWAKGLANQLYLAAQQFQRYRLNPGGFNYAKGKTSSIDYQALDKSCGSTTVTPRSAATAGLYNYTPYVPNAAALRVGAWQTGDRCSTYGNRNFVYIYDEWFGDPRQEVGANAAPPGFDVPSRRAGGSDRFSTAIAVSQDAYPQSGVAKVAYVARGDLVADALVAGSMTDGPLLLVPAKATAPSVALVNEIKRLGVQKVVLVGGESSMSVFFEGAMHGATRKPVGRAAGDSRVGTSIALSKLRYPGRAQTVYLADGVGPSGEGSPDAVAGAVLTDGPILLVTGAGADLERVKEEVARLAPSKVVALGGESAVPTSLLADVAGGRTTARLAGDSRFTTATAIAEHALTQLNLPKDSAYLVNSGSLVDAVVAGSYSRGPILLTYPQALAVPTRAFLTRHKPKSVTAVGGVNAVSQDTLNWAAYYAK